MKTEVVIVGTIGLDDIETPFGKTKDSLGGSGVYASLSASYFAGSGLVSIMGEDFPGEHVERLKQIDLSGVEKKGKNFRWRGEYHFDMNEAKTLETEINSLADFNPILPHDYRKAKYLFLGNTDPDIQLNVFDQMEGKPFVMLDTMNYWISNKEKELKKVIKQVDLLVLNEGEARQLAATPNLIIAGKKLLELGPRYVVVKKGEHGSLLFAQDQFFSASSYPLEELKDPTGAGDTFAGAMIGYLAKTGDNSFENIKKAIIYGSVIASFCAENFSINYQLKISLKEIEERFDEIKQHREF